MIGKHVIRKIAPGVALLASLPVLAAQPAFAFDSRSPDTRDAALQAKLGSVVDLRSPDTRAGAEQGKSSPGISMVDLRSPDAREDAEQREPVSVVASAVPAPQESVVSPDRFSWSNFGIGVGVAFGFILLVGGLAAGALAARRGRVGKAPATT